MTVKELKNLLDKLPDDTQIVTPAFDHSYRKATAHKNKALYRRRWGDYSEYYGEEDTNDNIVMDVVVVE